MAAEQTVDLSGAGLELARGATRAHWQPVTKDAASGVNTLILQGFPRGTQAVSVWISEMDEQQSPKWGTAIIKTESVQKFNNNVRVRYHNGFGNPLPIGAMIIYG